MSILIERLIDCGCNVQEAMSRFLNNEDFYAKCYAKFIEDKSFQKLGDAIKAGDAKAAFEAAHELKGISANMGITPIYDHVVNIVEEFRAGRMPENALSTWEEIMHIKETLQNL